MHTEPNVDVINALGVMSYDNNDRVGRRNKELHFKRNDHWKKLTRKLSSSFS